MTVWGVVLAGGTGTRFGAAKQFLTLGGQRLVDHAVLAATRCCGGVTVVLPGDVDWDGPRVDAAVGGGPTRGDSVRAGLASVPESTEVIVVHDAARPLAADALFVAVIDAVRAGADGAVPAVAVADTVKRVTGTEVIETLDRDPIVSVQTPQAFDAAALRRAHVRGDDATDDAALVERDGGSVVVVAGDPRNRKVTTPEDLVMLAALVADDGPADEGT